MESIINAVSVFSNFMWGAPLTILLIGTGIFSTVMFKGDFALKWWTHFKNTLGSITKASKGEGTISPFAAACTSLSNTLGMGNIAGVSTAIASGGPGAVFWMWIVGILGFSNKAAEVILGQRYRIKYDNMDEWACDRSIVLKAVTGWKVLPVILGVLTVLLLPWTNTVQTEASTSACYAAFGIQKTTVTALLFISCGLVIVGGLRRIANVMEKIIPVMGMGYILGVLVILAINYDQIIPTLLDIFKCAFNPAAAVGGFAGATVRDAMRYGVARGLFSNGAGGGYAIVAYSPAISDHPGRVASWGWAETFLDTIVVCTMSALAILTTDVYITNTEISKSNFVTAAFNKCFGSFGSAFAALAITLFAWTTVIGVYYATENTVKYLIGDNKNMKIGMYIFMAYYMATSFLFSNFEATLLWSAADILNLVFVVVTCFMILAKWKEIVSIYNDYKYRFLPALRQKEKTADSNQK